MSFINWGSETPEQRHRRRMEEQALLEQAVARKLFEQRAASQSAATSAAGASGSGAPMPSALGSTTSYVYKALNGEFKIGFLDYAIKGFSKEFSTGLNDNDGWFHDSNNYSRSEERL